MHTGAGQPAAGVPTDGLVVWRLLDGKAGHMQQTAGLTSALAQRAMIHQFELLAPTPAYSIAYGLRGLFPPAQHLPSPDLILAAGHATHLPAIAARRARGGRLVVLMRPTLPLSLFDLCLIPQHDAPPSRGNVLVTQGALNTIQPGGPHSAERGLFLIGGPSAAYGWDDDAVLTQIRSILARQPGMRFRLTTSRRTPNSLCKRLPGLTGLDVVPWQETDTDWVARELAAAGQAWVSEDSVSMVYEALTSGASVGLLAVPRKKTGRVALGVEQLVEHGRVVRAHAWLAGRPLPPPAGNFDEAGRCADEILRRWFKDA